MELKSRMLGEMTERKIVVVQNRTLLSMLKLQRLVRIKLVRQMMMRSEVTLQKLKSNTTY